MGASGSLFTATMTFEPFMPARCWIAPEMPAATYSSGATTLPVCPTCQSFDAQPAGDDGARLGQLRPLALHLLEADVARLERGDVEGDGDARDRALPLLRR